MELRIEVDPALTDLSAAIRESTYDRVQDLLRHERRVRGANYVLQDIGEGVSLNFLGDDEREADVLYVSPGAKETLYQKTERLSFAEK